MKSKSVITAISAVIIIILLLNMVFLALKKISVVFFWVNIILALIAVQIIKWARKKLK
jgi:uncharacterized membrane protein